MVTVSGRGDSATGEAGRGHEGALWVRRDPTRRLRGKSQTVRSLQRYDSVHDFARRHAREPAAELRDPPSASVPAEQARLRAHAPGDRLLLQAAQRLRTAPWTEERLNATLASIRPELAAQRSSRVSPDPQSLLEDEFLSAFLQSEDQVPDLDGSDIEAHFA